MNNGIQIYNVIVKLTAVYYKCTRVCIKNNITPITHTQCIFQLYNNITVVSPLLKSSENTNGVDML